ncbi:MAG TPA: hypothetical protein VKP69_26145, partial [Isosphaeraceae bacterium]|nr:hypothetical protein [Isosphaeraceae bacterium]
TLAGASFVRVTVTNLSPSIGTCKADCGAHISTCARSEGAMRTFGQQRRRPGGAVGQKRPWL